MLESDTSTRRPSHHFNQSDTYSNSLGAVEIDHSSYTRLSELSRAKSANLDRLCRHGVVLPCKYRSFVQLAGRLYVGGAAATRRVTTGRQNLGPQVSAGGTIAESCPYKDILSQC